MAHRKTKTRMPNYNILKYTVQWHLREC